MRELHQIGQGHNGVPRGIGDHLNREILVLDGIGFPRGHELGEVELLGLRPAYGQGHGFRYEDSARKDGQVPLLSI